MSARPLVLLVLLVLALAVAVLVSAYSTVHGDVINTNCTSLDGGC